ncbi:MAG: TetR family transcriptional regulator [Bradyrhizobium sp.]|nr:TetR family transcriptional regulator [Bradyrhizobium sp.]
MPRLTEARRRDRRQLLLDAARAAFAENGFEATSIAGIARAAGVSDGLIYRYFTDKRAVLAAVLEQFFSALIADAEGGVAEVQGFGPRLERLIAAHLGAYAGEMAICRLFLHEFRDAEGYFGSPIHALARRYTDLLIRLVDEGIEAGQVRADADARMLRDLVFGGMEHIAWTSISAGEPIEVPMTALRLTRLFMAGIAAGEI